MLAILRDFRYAFWTLRRAPGFALLCMGVLALGIGANAAIFSVLDAVILRALPYPDADRLVFVWERFPNMPPPFGPRMPVAYRNYAAWQRQTTVFSEMAAFRASDVTANGGAGPGKLSVGFANAGLFPMLGAQAALGRLFTAGDERDRSRVVVLSDKYFERRFHREQSAIGKAVALADGVYTVIGVMPPEFHVPSTWEGFDQIKPDLWAPLSLTMDHGTNPADRVLDVAARLKPGVSLERARAEMSGIAARLAQSDEFDAGVSASVFPFSVEDADPKVHRALYVLMAAVGFLLLIACANLANLTLVRASGRAREIGVRLALGATRGRIVSQLVSESLLVSLAGAGAGLLVAKWAVRLLLRLHPEGLQRPELISIDGRVFLFAALAGVVTAVLFGLAPAMSASRANLNTALRSGGSWGATATRLRSSQALIAVEVALALVLLVGAGLMIRSFRAILAVGFGFDTGRLTYADIELPADRYSNGGARARFFRNLLERTRAIPGVSGAGVVDQAPLHGAGFANFSVEGRPKLPAAKQPMADVAQTSPGYLRMIGLRLESGRWFTEADMVASGEAHVVIVDHAFVQRFFPGENPIGRRLGRDEKNFSEIVGVVSGYRALGVEGGTRPTIFWPNLALDHATLVVQSTMTAQVLAAGIRNAAAAADPLLPPPEARAVDYWVGEWSSQRKFNTVLLECFAGLSLLLGMLGVYGVLANLVASRTREIGIRLAIGATPGEVARLVLRQGMLPVAIGLCGGVTASLALGRFMESLLFQVEPRDPLTLAAACTAILLLAPLAILIPMRRATRVDCTTALRAD